MNEASSNALKLASRWSPHLPDRASSWRGGSQSLLVLGKGSQAARAHVHTDGAASHGEGHPLHVGAPAPLGVALRETDTVAGLWLCLATESTPMGHGVYPLKIAISLVSSDRL